MRNIQVDNQLPLTPAPVLFRPHAIKEDTNSNFKFSLTMESNGSADLCVYPYIGFQVVYGYGFLPYLESVILTYLLLMLFSSNVFCFNFMFYDFTLLGT